jgi:hypothetical protein
MDTKSKEIYYFGNNWGLFIDIDTNVVTRDVIIQYDVGEEEEAVIEENFIVIREKHKKHKKYKYFIFTAKFTLAVLILSLFSYIIFYVN